MTFQLVPPFDAETAALKVKAAEDAWNTRDPQKVAMAYSENPQWRNRDVFLAGRAAIVEFLTSKWAKVMFAPPVMARCFRGVHEALMSSIASLQEQAAELEEARDQAEAANVSHEFRASLNAIVGFAEIHQRKATDPR